MEEQRLCQKISFGFSSEPAWPSSDLELDLQYHFLYHLKLCQETLREILVDSDLIELNKMLAEGVLLEKIIKHFFQVKI